MTTMKRMVDEERTQIGVLKAMGYGRFQIMSKYLFYSGSAALLGSLIGYALGVAGLPWIIWEIYGLIYGFAPLEYTVLPTLASSSFAAALLCSMGATWLSCRMELKRQASELIRPKTPRAGKRVFLEYITPVWKRLSFLHKVSARNVLRYRSRLVMMVLGIGAVPPAVYGLRHSGLHRPRGGRPVRPNHPLRLLRHLPGRTDPGVGGGLPGPARLDGGEGPAGPQRQRGRAVPHGQQVGLSGDLCLRHSGRLPLPPQREGPVASPGRTRWSSAADWRRAWTSAQATR